MRQFTCDPRRASLAPRQVVAPSTYEPRPLVRVPVGFPQAKRNCKCSLDVLLIRFAKTLAAWQPLATRSSLRYGRLHENVHWTFAAVRMLALAHILVRSLLAFEKSDKNHILAHKACRCACGKPPVALSLPCRSSLCRQILSIQRHENRPQNSRRTVFFGKSSK